MKGPQRIHRVANAGRRRFTRIDNTAIEDPRLSFRALGVLTYVLSKPDDWARTDRDPQ
jgi:hypothetical protein